jgi:hypothetical membrane protein
MTATAHTTRPAHLLMGMTLGGATAFVVSVLTLHLVQHQLDPISVTISEYALGPAGWLFPVACAGLGVAALALSALLQATHPPISRTGVRLLYVWALGMLLVAIFPTDPIDRAAKTIHLTAHGLIHAIAGQIAFTCFGVGALLITRSMRRRFPTTPMMRAMCTCAALSVAGLAFSITVTALGLFDLFGLAERVMLPAYTAWLVITVLYARTHAQPRPRQKRHGSETPSPPGDALYEPACSAPLLRGHLLADPQRGGDRSVAPSR